MTLLELIHDALQSAFDESRSEKTVDRGRLHQRRSAAWVRALSGKLGEVYLRKNGFRVFSKPTDDLREEFDRNELLFDVSVCKVAALDSKFKRKELLYPSEAIWQIESEVKENDLRPLMIDFSKLVLGSAQHKLFVAPLESESKATENLMMNRMLPIAKACLRGGTRRVFFASIPHPKDWEKVPPKSEVFVLRNKIWVGAESESVNAG